MIPTDGRRAPRRPDRAGEGPDSRNAPERAESRAGPGELVHAMARVPGPVTVVTTVDGAGRRWGFTATSFTSVSLDPPLVLVCLGTAASAHPAFRAADRFLVNLLAEGQDDVARRFATSGIDRFAAADTTPCELGLPGVPQASVRVACRMHRYLPAGDHAVLLGRVQATYVSDRPPLMYFDRAFAALATASFPPRGNRRLSTLPGTS